MTDKGGDSEKLDFRVLGTMTRKQVQLNLEERAMGKNNSGTQCLPTGSWNTMYLLLLLLTVIETVKGDALISSRLVNCTRHNHTDNNTTKENVDCLKKMLIHLSVFHAKSGESDTMETFVTHVRDHGGVSRDLEEPYRITIYKSDVYAQYPLKYIQLRRSQARPSTVVRPVKSMNIRKSLKKQHTKQPRADREKVVWNQRMMLHIRGARVLSIGEFTEFFIDCNRFYGHHIDSRLTACTVTCLFQSFDGFPDEVELFAPDCKDDSNEKNSNCGWQYDKAGEKLKNSQGFCCLCTLKDKLPRWLGGHSSSRRSKQDCNGTWSSFLNLLPWRRRGSAHCLRHSTQWYPTYQIGSSHQSFTVRIVAHMVYSSGEASSLGKTDFDFVEVTSLKKVHINSRRTMKGKLQEHSMLTTEPLLLADRYLSIPYEEGKIDFSTNTTKWLALPKNFYTLDGSDCDKIGVSPNAFRSQVQPCSQVFQSCFGNQLDKFAKDETGRLARGENPLYALPRYRKMFAVHQTRNSTLNLLTNQTVTSLLSLELKADNLKYLLHRSPGKIVDATIKPPTSNLSEGLLEVEILNMGRITANFTLHTEECPLQLNMSTVSAFRLFDHTRTDRVEVSSSKPRNVFSSFTFNLSETDDIAYHSTCRVFLQDNMGDRTDVFEVKFDYPSREELAYLLRDETTGEAKGNSTWSDWLWGLFNWTRWFGGFNTTFNWCWFSCPDNTIETESSQYKCEYGGAVQQSVGEDGVIKCPGPPQNATGLLSIFNWTPCGSCANIILDFKCYVTTLCWREIITFLVYLLGALLVVYLIWLMHRAGILGPALKAFFEVVKSACKCLSKSFGGRESERRSSSSGGGSSGGSSGDSGDGSDSDDDVEDGRHRHRHGHGHGRKRRKRRRRRRKKRRRTKGC